MYRSLLSALQLYSLPCSLALALVAGSGPAHGQAPARHAMQAVQGTPAPNPSIIDAPPSPVPPRGAPFIASLPDGCASACANPPAVQAALSLPSAIALAFAANPELAAARSEVRANDGAIQQAGARPNPVVDLGVEDTRKETRETTLQLSQAIELGGKRSARQRSAQRGRDAALAELEIKQADIRAAVIGGFFELLTAQDRVVLSGEALELSRRATSIAARRVVAGKVSPVEETKANVAESGIRIELLQARNELQAARQRLAALWGATAASIGQVDGKIDVLPALPELAALTQRLASAPGMRRAQAEVALRQAMTEVERTRRVPDLTLAIGARRSEELGRNQAIFGISMPIPVFDTNRGNITESQHRTDKARDDLAGMQIRLASELALAHERLAALREEALAIQTQVLPGAHSAYTAAATGFEHGKFAFLDVLDAQRTLLQAKTQHLRTLADMHRAAAEIDRLLGVCAIETFDTLSRAVTSWSLRNAAKFWESIRFVKKY